MKVVCIIQARMGSSRLPGKVMKKICGKSVLQHDIERIRLVENIDDIVIATTNKSIDDEIVEEAKRLNIKYFRGEEQDVLSRYYNSAKESKSDIIVRITSDCPLIDFDVTKDTINLLLYNMDKYDYVSNTLERSFPRGLDTEVFKWSVLEDINYKAINKNDREHVTKYIYENPDIYRLGSYTNKIDLSKYRWTLDTEEDFKLISIIYEELYYKNENFKMNDILNLMESKTTLVEINKNITQKQI